MGTTETGTSNGSARFAWDGTLAVPNHKFDTTPPVIRVAKTKAKAPSHAKRVRVRFSATAHDAVDGRVPVSCKPRSGRRFKVGRTKVTCIANDVSLNTAVRWFTVIVTRAR